MSYDIAQKGEGEGRNHAYLLGTHGRSVQLLAAGFWLAQAHLRIISESGGVTRHELASSKTTSCM